MPGNKSELEQEWHTLIRQIPCLICSRFIASGQAVELHHVAQATRDEFGVVPLCVEHHRGASGLHGMGPKAFARLYRPPGDSEFGLLIWLNHDLCVTVRGAMQARGFW